MILSFFNIPDSTNFTLNSFNSSSRTKTKGTANYLPADTKGFNPDNWYGQMKTVFQEFSSYGMDFFLVDSTLKFDVKNVTHITKNDLCERLKII